MKTRIPLWLVWLDRVVVTTSSLGLLALLALGISNTAFGQISPPPVSYPIPISKGGTGQTSQANALTALLPSQTGNNGKVLGTNGTAASWVAAGSGSGTVTDVSVVSANGLSGTVANSTTTPAITLSTSITGMLKGNGTAISAAASGTDYAPATSGTSVLKGNGSGGFSNAASGDIRSMWSGTCDGTTYLRGDGACAVAGGTGTVTTVSVVSANGLSGTVANASTTPAITLSTSISGVLKGSGGAVAAAVNTDLPAMTATQGGAVPTPPNDSNYFLNGAGAFSIPAGASTASGSFTPQLTFETPGDLSVGYTYQTGYYYQINKIVVAVVRVVTSSFTYTGSTGTLRITGLPVAAKTGDWWYYGALRWRGFVPGGALSDCSALVQGGASIVLFSCSGPSEVGSLMEAGTQVPSGGTVTLLFTLTYLTD